MFPFVCVCVCAACSAAPSLGYLQALGWAGAPEPLDVWRRDPVGRAVKRLPAPPRYRAGLPRRHGLLPDLRSHCRTNAQSQLPPLHRVSRVDSTDKLCVRSSPFTTSVSVRFCCSPCSRIRASTVYSPASSAATSLITSEVPSMWYLEHCSAATIPSFSLSPQAAKVIAKRSLDCFKLKNEVTKHGSRGGKWQSTNTFLSLKDLC